MNHLKKWEGFALYVILILGIVTLRLVSEPTEQGIVFVHSVIDVMISIAEYLNLTQLVLFLQRIPIRLVLMALGMVEMMVGFFVLACFKRQMEQGAMLLLEEFLQVLKSGIVLYGMFIALLLISAYSVVGLPFGAALFVFTNGIAMIGKIPLAVVMGYLLLERLSVAGYTYIYFFAGGFVILLFECVYAIGGAFLVFVFPVLSLGIIFTLILYRCFYKISYPVKFPVRKGQEAFDRKKIRDIITKGK